MANVSLTLDLQRLPLGRGAYSTVYPARTADGRTIAAKLVGNTHSDIVPTIRELLFTATLCHPHILSTVTCGMVPKGRKPPSWTHGFRPAVYMGFPRATETLHALSERTHRAVRDGSAPPWSCAAAAAALAGVGDAVAFLHSVGVIHRDVKPHNILMFRTGEATVAKLADFGLAVNTSGTTLICEDPQPPRWIEENDRERHSLTSAVVTRPYRAPELCVVGMPYDHRVDDWSFGCVLFEALLAFEPTCVRVEYLFGGGGAVGGRTDSRVSQLHPDRAWWYGADTRGQLAAIARKGVFFTAPDDASPVRMIAAVTECHARVVAASRKPMVPLCAQLARRLPRVTKEHPDFIGVLCELLYPWPARRARCREIVELLRSDGARAADADLPEPAEPEPAEPEPAEPEPAEPGPAEPGPAEPEPVHTVQVGAVPAEPDPEPADERPAKRPRRPESALGPRLEDIIPDGVPADGAFDWSDIVARTNALIERRAAYEEDADI
jgi:hypothetical protein